MLRKSLLKCGSKTLDSFASNFALKEPAVRQTACFSNDEINEWGPNVKNINVKK